MPMVNDKKFAYTKEGKAKAKEAKNKAAAKKKVRGKTKAKKGS